MKLNTEEKKTEMPFKKQVLTKNNMNIYDMNDVNL